MTEAFKYIKKAGGIQTAEDYGKYKVRVEDCHFDESKVAAKISDYYLIQRSEDAIKKELVLNGPIAIGFNAKKL